MSTKKKPKYSFDDQKEIVIRPLCTRSGKELNLDSKFLAILVIIDHFWPLLEIVGNFWSFWWVFWYFEICHWREPFDTTIGSHYHICFWNHVLIFCRYTLRIGIKMPDDLMNDYDGWMNVWMNQLKLEWTGLNRLLNLLVLFVGLYCDVYETSYDVSVLVFDLSLRLNIIQRSFLLITFLTLFDSTHVTARCRMWAYYLEYKTWNHHHQSYKR